MKSVFFEVLGHADCSGPKTQLKNLNVFRFVHTKTVAPLLGIHDVHNGKNAHQCHTA